MAGDWEQFAKASDALNSLSFFCADLAQDLQANITALLTSWTEMPADEAYQYFDGLSETTKGYASGLAALRDKYREAAQGVGEFSETINDVIQDIFDSIFWGAVELAAAWSTGRNGRRSGGPFESGRLGVQERGRRLDADDEPADERAEHGACHSWQRARHHRLRRQFRGAPPAGGLRPPGVRP